jgi:hypothetical protein
MSVQTLYFIDHHHYTVKTVDISGVAVEIVSNILKASNFYEATYTVMHEPDAPVLNQDCQVFIKHDDTKWFKHDDTKSKWLKTDDVVIDYKIYTKVQ